MLRRRFANDGALERRLRGALFCFWDAFRGLLPWRRAENDPSRSLGQRGECAAVRYLRRRGYRILARGFTSAAGEIDIVALAGQTLVFVEVKTRRRATHGLPVDAVGSEKQSHVSAAAATFLKRYRQGHRAHRFDVVGIVWPQGGIERPSIEHYEDAF